MTQSAPDPQSKPELDLVAVVETLGRYDVRYVLAGSIVLRAYGADLVPGDLDVVPALDPTNLEAVASVLDDLTAVPFHFVDWPECPPPEWHTTWRSRPPTVTNLDHLFVTTSGRVDIVPSLCGSYEELAATATLVEMAGRSVALADPASVLARIDSRDRPKDAVRQQALDAVRRQIEAGTRAPRDPTHLA